MSRGEARREKVKWKKNCWILVTGNGGGFPIKVVPVLVRSQRSTLNVLALKNWCYNSTTITSTSLGQSKDPITPVSGGGVMDTERNNYNVVRLASTLLKSVQ